MVWDKVYLSTCDYPNVLVPFLKKRTIPSLLKFLWHLCQKSIGHKYKGFFLDSRFSSIDRYDYSYEMVIFLVLSEGMHGEGACPAYIGSSRSFFFSSIK